MSAPSSLSAESNHLLSLSLRNEASRSLRKLSSSAATAAAAALASAARPSYNIIIKIAGVRFKIILIGNSEIKLISKLQDRIMYNSPKTFIPWFPY